MFDFVNGLAKEKFENVYHAVQGTCLHNYKHLKRHSTRSLVLQFLKIFSWKSMAASTIFEC